METDLQVDAVRVPVRDSAVLQAARADVETVTSGLHPVQLDGTRFAGLPDRLLGVGELRHRLLAPACPPATRDAVWAHVVLRARGEVVFRTVAVGLALPTLMRLAARCSARFADDPADVHAAVLTGFLAALDWVDVSRAHIAVRLRWAAYRAGRAAVGQALQAPTPSGVFTPAVVLRPPVGHPEQVLDRAVAEAVLRASEAELIAATRFGHESLQSLARARGLGYQALHRRRRRAEHRLARWLAQPDPDEDEQTPTSRSPARPVSKTGPLRRVPFWNESQKRSSPSVSGPHAGGCSG